MYLVVQGWLLNIFSRFLRDPNGNPSTPATLDKKMPNSEEGALIFIFLLDSAQGASEDPGTFNLGNLCKR